MAKKNIHTAQAKTRPGTDSATVHVANGEECEIVFPVPEGCENVKAARMTCQRLEFSIPGEISDGKITFHLEPHHAILNPGGPSTFIVVVAVDDQSIVAYRGTMNGF
ncbi:hypothetical protein [Crateriforma conspicua]|uniref:Uncharacterized protein n=1 Tax=Crateriforma conspicua TaxID=2527996 RepID=A0A5C5Y2V4_9PLAN|nr:hypothetical protein [Crateriforma conspicua]TWT70007.1 hypothetical protein Pan14r_23040 [Crateriforma conspicua]